MSTTVERIGTASAADVVVRGAGQIAAAIAMRVAANALVESSPQGTGFVVSASDGWLLTDTLDRERRAALGAAWLPVSTELHHVVIGPLEEPGRPGCTACAAVRRNRARAHPDGHAAVITAHGERLETTATGLVTPLAADSVAALVAAEAENVRTGKRPRTRGAILILDLRDLTVSRHSFLPEPCCPVCGGLPDDEEASARISLCSRPKLAANTYRGRRVIDDLELLRDLYVDEQAGLIRGIVRGRQAGLALTSAAMRLRSGHGEESGIGRTRSYRSSELVAVLEALERYGGVNPGGKRTIVRGSYAEFADRALDVRTTGVHSPEAYASPGFPYRPFTPEAVCRWVWGYSFARAEPILVPETLAYYHLHARSAEELPFVYEISNGCALGASLEEAILHGIFEAAERDAFLMTWYGRLPVPRIVLESARDRAIPVQAKAISLETGFDVLAFDTTMEYGIPSVWALAVNRDTGADTPGIVCAAGSSLDLEQAVLNALSELGSIVPDVQQRFTEDSIRGREMVIDPEQVLSMADHATLAAQPAILDRFDFLMNSAGRRELSSSESGAFHGADLRDDLTGVIANLATAGMDVIVVDQTTPEHRAGGFHCVKVLVPGLLPMTFGHANRRLDGLPRLEAAPALNPHPHPFP